jgi:hypothetical protein
MPRLRVRRHQVRRPARPPHTARWPTSDWPQLRRASQRLHAALLFARLACNTAPTHTRLAHTRLTLSSRAPAHPPVDAPPRLRHAPADTPPPSPPRRARSDERLCAALGAGQGARDQGVSMAGGEGGLLDPPPPWGHPAGLLYRACSRGSHRGCWPASLSAGSCTPCWAVTDRTARPQARTSALSRAGGCSPTARVRCHPAADRASHPARQVPCSDLPKSVSHPCRSRPMAPAGEVHRAAPRRFGAGGDGLGEPDRGRFFQNPPGCAPSPSSSPAAAAAAAALASATSCRLSLLLPLRQLPPAL